MKVVEEGNYLKFTQNAELKGLLLKTGDAELVEVCSLTADLRGEQRDQGLTNALPA